MSKLTRVIVTGIMTVGFLTATLGLTAGNADAQLEGNGTLSQKQYERLASQQI
ncbi:hypothetical protein QUH70_08900 [Staphylococcus felis]|uniref:hypothetical protein n=1 Tax=Staphylococcus felis TaxID=46127 RepID=UPI0015F27F6E|nr:hypothetical protein [Staphylococcus felis]MDM8328276.1 hypothetical protein [Staphylococcus felis]MDQ7193801.1 hypothetical protein [Staphylococcus felis]